MNSSVPQRGHIYRILRDPDSEIALLGLVVSTNAQNSQHDKCVVVQVIGRKDVPSLPSFVPLRSGDPAFGHVVVRHVGRATRSELKEDLGALSLDTMLRVEQVLRLVLGL